MTGIEAGIALWGVDRHVVPRNEGVGRTAQLSSSDKGLKKSIILHIG